MKRDELATRLEELTTRQQDMLSAIQAEKRDPTEEERRELDSFQEEFDRVASDLERLTRFEEQANRLNAGRGRQTEPNVQTRQLVTPEYEPVERGTSVSLGPNPNPNPQQWTTGNGSRGNRPLTVPAEVRRGDAGFRTLGDFAMAVRTASARAGAWDPRLQHLAPTTVANEATGAEGGFMVPSDFRSAIMEKVTGEASLLSRTDQIQISGNSINLPKDNSTPWGTSGMRAYWGSEGALKTQSRPAFDQMGLRLQKVYCLVPVTDELAEDAPALDSYLRRKMPEYIDFAINLAIVQGTGIGQPLGILNSGALISVAKESSQVADTIVPMNIIKMWSRLYSPNRANAVWLVNQDIETQLYTLAMPGKDNTGAAVAGWGSHVFMPAGGLSGSPYSTLFGRPIIPTQACETLGDKGDIILADLSQYVTAMKMGPNPKIDVSIHLWFEYDTSAFRAVLRITGAPWWDAPVSPRDGSSTLSPFVTLDERA